MEKINFRQLAIIASFLLLTTKVLALPALLHNVADNNSWLVVLFGMLFDAIFIYAIVYLLKKSQEKNFYEFLKARVGSVITRIVCFLFAIYGLISVANVLKSFSIFLTQSLYREFAWYLIALPLFAVCGFVIYKGILNIGRLCEIFIYLIIASTLLIAFIAFKKVDWYYFLPIMGDGFGPILQAFYRCSMWFGSPCLLFLLFGHVDLSTDKKWIITKYIIFALLVIQTFLIIFYGLFQVNSGIHWFAISDIIQYSTKNAALDETQWVIVLTWMIIQMIEINMFGFLVCRAIQYTFSIKSIQVPILILLTLLSVWTYLFCHNLKLANLFLMPAVNIFALIVQYGIPIFIFITEIIYSIKNCKKFKRDYKMPMSKNIKIKNSPNKKAKPA